IDAPAGNGTVRDSVEAVGVGLSLTERKIEDVTDDQSLGDVLRGKRPFSLQVVLILNRSDSASVAFEPTGQRVGIAHQLSVGVGHEQGTTAWESPCHAGL